MAKLTLVAHAVLQSFAMKADFSNADMTAAVLNGVDFTGANLKGESSYRLTTSKLALMCTWLCAVPYHNPV